MFLTGCFPLWCQFIFNKSRQFTRKCENCPNEYLNFLRNIQSYEMLNCTAAGSVGFLFLCLFSLMCHLNLSWHHQNTAKKSETWHREKSKSQKIKAKQNRKKHMKEKKRLGYLYSIPSKSSTSCKQAKKNVLKNVTIGPSISQSKPNNHLKNWQAFKKEQNTENRKNKNF